MFLFRGINLSMLDIERLRDDPLAAEAGLARRDFLLNLSDSIFPLSASLFALGQELDELRRQRNEIAEAIKQHYAGEGNATEDKIAEFKGSASELRGVIRSKEAVYREMSDEFRVEMLGIPNIPAAHTPDGLDYEDFELMYAWGDKVDMEEPEDHSSIGARLGIIDTTSGTNLAGPRFSVLRGQGASLQRALINFFMDQNVLRGYEEYTVPYIVNPTALEGTGQLPKFKDDIFRTSVGGREMFLSPTAEVQLTNLVRDRVFTEDELPHMMTAYSENFRAEAGSAGKDTAGIFRQHQFPKLELVRVVHPEQSWQQLEDLTFDAESCLRALGLHYRKVALSAGDIGFSAAFTYDLEVWLPGQGKYREVSSCSNYLDFQARRINAKYRNSENKKDYVHTINGSSLAVGRTIVALLEQGQQPDGTVKIPDALQDYTKYSVIQPSES